MTTSTIKNKDLLAVRAYVTAKDETQYDDVGASTVILDLTHSNLKQRHAEQRFDRHATIYDLRQRIHQKTGTPPTMQHLQIISTGIVLMEIPPEHPEHYPLGYFGLEHGMTVHCLDLDPFSGSSGGAYEDTTLVEKYTMSEADYDKREGTLRDWERQQKVKSPSFTLAKHAKQHRELVEARRQWKMKLPLPPGFEYNERTKQVERVEDEEELAPPIAASKRSAEEEEHAEFGVDTVQGIDVGMRCEVKPGARRGQVVFCDVIKELGGGGYWVGVLFDEPVGRTDGTLPSGKRLFEAPIGRGGFVRGKNLQVGDFPERDIFDEFSDDDSEEDEL